MKTHSPSTPGEKNQSVNLNAIATLMINIANLETADLGHLEDEPYLRRASIVRLGLFRLVVMGEVKKGKSSFINALCGIADLVPVADDIVTSTIFKIRYGPAVKYTVYFLSTTGKPKKELGSDPDLTLKVELEKYGTETGNPGNTEGVDFIAVEAPSPLLRSSGLVIVDTPGVGGLFKEHRDITFKHAPNADAVFFVTDSVDPIGKDEVAFLKELQKITQKIYFIQTKADKVTPEEAIARMNTNLTEKLAREAGFDVDALRYFILSSVLKLDADKSRDNSRFDDLKDSGYIPLMRFLNADLKANLNQSIGKDALRLVRTKLELLTQEVAWRRKLLEADSADKWAQVERELKDAHEAVEQWRIEKAPLLKRDFYRKLSEIIDSTTSELLMDLRPGGVISENAAEALAVLPSAQKIYSHARGLFDDARATASVRLIETSHDLEGKLKEFVISFEKAARASIEGEFSDERVDRVRGLQREPASLTLAGSTALRNLTERASDGRYFDHARNAFVAGTTAVGMGAIVGGVIGSVFPVVGTAIGVYAGTILPTLWAGGALLGLTGGKRAETDGARRHVRDDIDRLIGNLHAQASSELKHINSTLCAQADEAIDGIIASLNKHFKERQLGLEQRKRETGKAIEQKTALQRTLESKLSQFTGELQFLEAQVN